MRIAGWTGVACIAALLGPWAGRADASGHHGDALLRVSAWPEELGGLGLDVWTDRPTAPELLVRVSPEQRAQLDATGFAYEVIEPDLGPWVDAERARIAAAARPAPGLDLGFYAEYRDLEAVYRRLDELAAAEPKRVRSLSIGESIEGRPLRALRLGRIGRDDRPVITVVACQHAREWISLAATLWATEQIATAPSGSHLDALLDQVELVVIPVLNPDGYVRTWEDERFWRKNRRDDHGVDLNRNWSVAWGGPGSSPYPYDENFRGAQPFSEPESAALRDLVTGDPDQLALLDVHSYGQLVLYPWGFDTIEAPDADLLAELGTDLAEELAVPHGTEYQPLQSADFYPAAGNSMDWAYGQAGLYAFGLELRPDVDTEPGFLLGPEHIVPTGEELLGAIEVLVESTVALGPGEAGDSGGPVPGTGAGDEGGDDGGRPSVGTDDDEPWPPPGGTGSTTGAEEPAMLDDTPGCGCRTEGRGGAGWWALLLGLAARRRRARARARAA
ncbi:MAG: hypothetical protein KC501_07795 [Myxococcales bacterium]|nr:hypothetical protein [Myxococcales bacterium]